MAENVFCKLTLIHFRDFSKHRKAVLKYKKKTSHFAVIIKNNTSMKKKRKRKNNLTMKLSIHIDIQLLKSILIFIPLNIIL